MNITKFFEKFQILLCKFLFFYPIPASRNRASDRAVSISIDVSLVKRLDVK